MEILLGADPEVFVTRDGKFHSGFGLIPGTKLEPHKVADGAVQVDGMALEFNIDPCRTEDEFVSRINSVLNALRARVPDYGLSLKSVAMFEKSHFDAQPDEAKELGCEPDFNAWLGGKPNPRPDNKTTMRTAGGHVHIGWVPPGEDGRTDPNHTEMCQQLVRQLDFYLGLPALLFDPEVKRREMYGKAGAYRVKPYGVEYRSLSNRWISNDGLIRWVNRATRKAVDDLMNGIDRPAQYGDIQSIINTSNISSAQHLIKTLHLDCDFGNSVESLRHAA
jgi:hypothetical protein